MSDSKPPAATSSAGPKRAASTSRGRRRDSQRPLDEGWRRTLYDIIFEADTPAGKWFDISLLVAILVSIAIVAMETVPEYRDNRNLFAAEIVCTFLFTAEYLLRVVCVRHPVRYIFSFWGLVDLLSFMPSWITLFVGSSNSSRSFVILRSIRLLRVFRVLKLWRMMDEADELASAVWKARNKIIVFLMVVVVAVTISGTLMYHIETVDSSSPDGIDPTSQFTSIPQSMYWAIVTMTTVGYGDIVPHTNAGKVISAMLILLGYSLIIVPSTFVSAEIIQKTKTDDFTACQVCQAKTHLSDASYCYRCGAKFD